MKKIVILVILVVCSLMVANVYAATDCEINYAKCKSACSPADDQWCDINCQIDKVSCAISLATATSVYTGSSTQEAAESQAKDEAKKDEKTTIDRTKINLRATSVNSATGIQQSFDSKRANAVEARSKYSSSLGAQTGLIGSNIPPSVGNCRSICDKCLDKCAADDTACPMQCYLAAINCEKTSMMTKISRQ